MGDHPYATQPAHAKWSKAVARARISDVDPVVQGRFLIGLDDKVVTAGSCFAQHIARRLSGSGFNFHVTEKPHPLIAPEIAETYNYGVFSARYGNVYTSRQLLELLLRAQGSFEPLESHWLDDAGNFYDPYRPAVHPGGFASLEELIQDRDQHLRATLRAFEEMDVFIFTLGLTEGWISSADGANFPSCPGVIAGKYNPDRYRFINLSVEQVVSDVSEFIRNVRSFNPSFRMILTVSPVPLAATATDQHVLTATSYSKAVLRVAAELISAEDPELIAYFPSYEIITGNFSRGAYYAEDLRNVLESGVDHVMKLFFRHYTSVDVEDLGNSNTISPTFQELDHMNRLVRVQCEEAMLDSGL
ncbi:GSCFA domain-containing protein [Sphingobium sp. SA916]|uniref:GSCFA domain-containing protein n=1 Tax=Sphingobium sp. SA916 TaxID=1851207 RepID=UPI000C9F8F1B|nr:GSCFA domain-containing protein [Sphingobium sp. SA916]